MQKLSPSTFKQLYEEAERGGMQAQYALGGAYYNGNGTSRNPTEGAKWLLRAAEQGHIAAQCDLGVMYQKGEGVEQDYRETLKWYRLAAEQGDARAQHNLGSLNAKGFKVKGMSFFNQTTFAFLKATQDFVEAYKWFSLAAANGHTASRKDRMIIKMRMSAAQVSKAEDLIKAFQKKPDTSLDPRLQTVVRTMDLFKSGTAWELISFESKQWLFDYISDSRHPAAPEQIKANAIALAEYLAIESDGVLTPSMTEHFSKRFEDFLITNTAPNKPMSLAFLDFKDWLITAYKSVEKSQGQIAPDIQDWYRRVLTVNDASNIVFSTHASLARRP
jgi:TPR repeat protein